MCRCSVIDKNVASQKGRVLCRLWRRLECTAESAAASTRRYYEHCPYKTSSCSSNSTATVTYYTASRVLCSVRTPGGIRDGGDASGLTHLKGGGLGRTLPRLRSHQGQDSLCIFVAHSVPTFYICLRARHFLFYKMRVAQTCRLFTSIISCQKSPYYRARTLPTNPGIFACQLRRSSLVWG